ncbi:hypothetical protein RUND412_006343 [Rhizina undulata]
MLPRAQTCLMKPYGRKASTIGKSRFGNSGPSEERIRRVRWHNMLFSNTFVKAVFPHDGIELDLRDVPKLDGDVGEDEEMTLTVSHTILESFVDENMAQNSIFVSPEDILHKINIGIAYRQNGRICETNVEAANYIGGLRKDTASEVLLCKSDTRVVFVFAVAESFVWTGNEG